MTKKRIAAFFDIDGTIFRNSLLVEHFKYMAEEEWFNIPQVWNTKVQPLYEKYTNREGLFETYLDTTACEYAKTIQGIDIRFLRGSAKEVVKEMKKQIYKTTSQAIENHKDKGHLVFFISGSPDYLVYPFANNFPIDGAYASKYKVKDNKFTGEVEPMWDSKSKQKTINSLVDKYNIDLSKSYAYGDTKGDLSMMRLVGNPRLVNPSYSLLEIAKNENMKGKILVERKDVTYTIDIDDVEFKKIYQ